MHNSRAQCSIELFVKAFHKGCRRELETRRAAAGGAPQAYCFELKTEVLFIWDLNRVRGRQRDRWFGRKHPQIHFVSNTDVWWKKMDKHTTMREKEKTTFLRNWDGKKRNLKVHPDRGWERRKTQTNRRCLLNTQHDFSTGTNTEGHDVEPGNCHKLRSTA